MKMQFKITFVILLSAAIFYPASTNAQVESKWEKQLPGSILWQEITALGNLIVCTDNALQRIDTETGEIVWSINDFANISRGIFQELPASPFFKVEGYENNFYLIDQFGGDIVFNAKKASVSDIKDYFMLYDYNAILVAGSNASGEPTIFLVNMSDASVTWSISEKFGRVIAANELGNNDLLVVTLFNNYKIHSETGEIIWKKANSAQSEQLDKMGKFGSFMKSLTEELVKDEEIKVNFYMNPGDDTFYLGGDSEEEDPFNESRMKYSSSYSAYKIGDGSLVWEDYIEVKGKSKFVLFEENGLLILPDNGYPTTINLYDYQTGKGLWGRRGNGIDLRGGVYNYIKTDKGILLATIASSKNFLTYLDIKTGESFFKKPVGIDGYIAGIVPMDNAMLYLTSSSINILDLNTGSLRWKKGIPTNPDLTGERNGNIYVFDTKQNTLKVVDMQDGAVQDLTTSKLSFDGKESPNKLELLEDGILLYSDQNISKYSYDGALVYNNYFPAPKESGWKQALLYASAVYAALASAESYYNAAQLASVEDDVRQVSKSWGKLTSKVKDAYAERGDQASDYFMTALSAANARKKATASGQNFHFVMTKKDKDIVLLNVNKMTGKVDGEILLGKNREPVYAVDNITAQVYLLDGTKNLVSYQVVK